MMIKTAIATVFLGFIMIVPNGRSQNIENNAAGRPDYAIVIHGGAGNFTQEDLSIEEEQKYRELLDSALCKGIKILETGGTALDAVESAICFMEDSPFFNAGKGAVFTYDGHNELDASVMDGKTLNAGAVAGVTDIKNPIRAARKVMTGSEHVMLTGKGASLFAKSCGLEIVDSSYFYTEKAWKALQKKTEKENKKGTVGCVALDKEGNLAAGTSTGGMTGKKYGRIGDSPVIGAGTYANNNSCAVSSTGHGEFFIRYVVAYDISALMNYKGMKLSEATGEVINQKLKQAGGSGGVIAVDKDGNISMTFNTSGMFRAYQVSGGKKEILLYK